MMENITVAAFTILSLVALVIVYIFNGISTRRQSRLFRYAAGDISKRYETDINPADYTYRIWSLIFFWQAVWTIYAVGSIWRTTEDGEPILMNPDILPIGFHMFWTASCILNVVWLFLWDRECLFFAFIDLFLLTLSGFAATGMLSVAIAVNKDTLTEKSSLDLTLVYVLVQNGTDLLYSWTTVATFMNLSVALAHDPIVKSRCTVSKELASTISLVLLGSVIAAWSILENTVLYDHFQFVYAWYGVLLWATIGMLVKNYDTSNRNTILTLILLCLSIACCVIKIVIYANRIEISRR